MFLDEKLDSSMLIMTIVCFALVLLIMIFALVMMIIIVKEFFNKKFKSEDDIDSVLNLPVIGTIPAVERKEFSK